MGMEPMISLFTLLLQRKAAPLELEHIVGSIRPCKTIWNQAKDEHNTNF